MGEWLDPLENALIEKQSPVTFFFRDDDAGWCDQRLFELLGCFKKFQLPVDLAVIPTALDHRRATRLYECVLQSRDLVGLHQHGFAHANHQSAGRKCEFGDARSFHQQKSDIEAGWKLLQDYFGEQLDSIFTPPWNRCSLNTANVLRDLGFWAISRDSTANLLEMDRLCELPIHVDWLKKRNGTRLSYEELGAWMERSVISSEFVGIMLHHQLMDKCDRAHFCQLLGLLSRHPSAHCVRMKNVEAGSV